MFVITWFARLNAKKYFNKLLTQLMPSEYWNTFTIQGCLKRSFVNCNLKVILEDRPLHL